jgi:hypothetical protein
MKRDRLDTIDARLDTINARLDRVDRDFPECVRRSPPSHSPTLASWNCR